MTKGKSGNERTSSEGATGLTASGGRVCIHILLCSFRLGPSQAGKSTPDRKAMQKQEKLPMWQTGACLWKPSNTTEADNSEIKFSGASQLAEGSFCGT